MNAKIITENEMHLDSNNIITQKLVYEFNPTHSHEFIEFFYVASGSCIHEIEGAKNNLTIGDAKIIVPGDSHRLYNAKNGFTYRNILFKIDFFKKFCNEYSPDLFNQIMNKKIKLTFLLSNEQINQLEILAPNVNDDNDKTTISISERAVCSFVINLIIQNLFHETKAYPIWITKIISFFDSFEEPAIPLEEITSQFSYTKEYMCRTFKKYTGMTMTDYYNKRKMKHAYLLLKTTNKTTEEICELVGLNNISHFYALFKKEFGLTPNSLRQKVKE